MSRQPALRSKAHPKAGRPSTAALYACALILLAGCPEAGCPGEAAEDQATSRGEALNDDSSSEPSPPQAAERRPSPVHQAWQRAKTDHARFLALAANRDGHRHDVEVRYPRIFENLELYRRVPLGLDLMALKSALTEHAASAGLEVQDFRAELRPAIIPEDRVIPVHLGPDDPFGWLPDEVRREVDLELLLAPPDLEKLERWFATRGSAGPIFLVRSLRTSEGGAQIELTTYYFAPEVKVPLRRAPHFDAEALLAEAGVDPGSPDPRIDEVKKMFAELESRREEIDEALAWRSRADLLDVRNRFFTREAGRMEEERWIDVLR